MTLRQELSSWIAPPSVPTSSVPAIASPAPSVPHFRIPTSKGNPTLVAFLRHCGCPFAEKTFISLRSTASSHPDIDFVAISHSSQDSTDRWLEAIGGPGRVRVIVDEGREIFAAWGLGISGWWHVLSPWSMWNVLKLGREEGIYNRPTESGSRWQRSGNFAIDGEGIMRWGGASERADETPDWAQAVTFVEGKQ